MHHLKTLGIMLNTLKGIQSSLLNSVKCLVEARGPLEVTESNFLFLPEVMKVILKAFTPVNNYLKKEINAPY